MCVLLPDLDDFIFLSLLLSLKARRLSLKPYMRQIFLYSISCRSDIEIGMFLGSLDALSILLLTKLYRENLTISESKKLLD